jgi:2-polyprenyl-3-methyl-5-hydroxy-6-metoxy-1,4-benzoquinol methylase
MAGWCSLRDPVAATERRAPARTRVCAGASGEGNVSQSRALYPAAQCHAKHRRPRDYQRARYKIADMRSLSSLLSMVRTAFAPADSAPRQPPADERLFRDGHHFWAEADARPQEVRAAMYKRYPLIARAYVDRYLDQIFSDHRPNPMAPLYIESELGAPARQLALLDELEKLGMRVAGRRCLDIGCSNGSLLLAAKRKGAARCVGVDVSQGRINSARQLCEGAGVELFVGDLAAQDLPAGCGPFDIMFCTDVLEHVGSVPGILNAMARLLSPGSNGRIFAALFNHLHGDAVASEPHYGVPGLVLIDRDTAAEIWSSVRTGLHSNLDYEVEHWPEYASLELIATAASLRMTPHLDVRGVLASRHRWRGRAFWAGYAERLAALKQTSAAKLDTLTMSAAHRALLNEAIAGYCREALDSHRRFEVSLRAATDQDIVAFYLRYYAQPLRFFLSRV